MTLRKINTVALTELTESLDIVGNKKLLRIILRVIIDTMSLDKKTLDQTMYLITINSIPSKDSYLYVLKRMHKLHDELGKIESLKGLNNCSLIWTDGKDMLIDDGVVK